MFKIILVTLFISITFPSIADVNVSHAIAMHGSPKYDSNFTHVDYVNPNAPKGGLITYSAVGSYDSFNPFILKGQGVAGIGNLFETLTRSSSDEAFTEYGLLAETIEWPDDRSWVAFTLRKDCLLYTSDAADE